ncbi:MAG: peptide deformylase [Alphaproteobacteria bacterium]|nr:peptide deformylase [Alphaproteobacteria bacterium]
MANEKKLTLVIEPDSILHQISEKVENITNDLDDTLNEMAHIMEQFDGIGLAGPQVGILKRIIIIDAETIAREEKLPLPKKRYLKIINPEIIEVSKETCLKEEGCLSLPTIYYTVERPEKITIKYFDEGGQELTLSADGLLARCIEHEIDHLNGKIFIDYVGPLKRKLALTKLKKMKPRK